MPATLWTYCHNIESAKTPVHYKEIDCPRQVAQFWLLEDFFACAWSKVWVKKTSECSTLHKNVLPECHFSTSMFLFLTKTFTAFLRWYSSAVKRQSMVVQSCTVGSVYRWHKNWRLGVADHRHGLYIIHLHHILYAFSFLLYEPNYLKSLWVSLLVGIS